MKSVVVLGSRGVVRVARRLSGRFRITGILEGCPGSAIVVGGIGNFSVPIVSKVYGAESGVTGSVGYRISRVARGVVRTVRGPVGMSGCASFSRCSALSVSLSGVPVLGRCGESNKTCVATNIMFTHSPMAKVRGTSVREVVILSGGELIVEVIPEGLCACFRGTRGTNRSLRVTVTVKVSPTVLLTDAASVPVSCGRVSITGTFGGNRLRLVGYKSLRIPRTSVVLRNGVSMARAVTRNPFISLASACSVVHSRPVVGLRGVRVGGRGTTCRTVLPTKFRRGLLRNLPRRPEVFGTIGGTIPAIRGIILARKKYY